MNTACREMLWVERASKTRFKKRVVQDYDLSFILIIPLQKSIFSDFPKSTTSIMDITISERGR